MDAREPTCRRNSMQLLESSIINIISIVVINAQSPKDNSVADYEQRYLFYVRVYTYIGTGDIRLIYA